MNLAAALLLSALIFGFGTRQGAAPDENGGLEFEDVPPPTDHGACRVPIRRAFPWWVMPPPKHFVSRIVRTAEAL